MMKYYVRLFSATLETKITYVKEYTAHAKTDNLYTFKLL